MTPNTFEVNLTINGIAHNDTFDGNRSVGKVFDNFTDAKQYAINHIVIQSGNRSAVVVGADDDGSMYAALIYGESFGIQPVINRVNKLAAN
jgi:hypothetical protein